MKQINYTNLAKKCQVHKVLQKEKGSSGGCASTYVHEWEKKILATMVKYFQQITKCIQT